MHNSSDAQLYLYDPSLAAAIIFIILFTLTTTLHLYQAVRTKTWFMIPLIIGGVFEMAGYIGRAMCSHQSPNYALGPYIMQIILILLAPLFFAATIYMELGRIIRAVHGEKASFIRPQVLTKLFVAGDILSFLVQSNGGGIITSAKKPETAEVGAYIIITGLALQLLFFSLFVLVAITFHHRLSKLLVHSSSVDSSNLPSANTSSIPWRKHLPALYAASALIMLRSIFRIVEYVQGNDGFLLGHEYFLYVFDATLMFVLLAVLNVVHPSEVKAVLTGGGKMVKGLVSVVEK